MRYIISSKANKFKLTTWGNMKLLERLTHIHKETRKIEKDMVIAFGNGLKVEICSKPYKDQPTLSFTEES